MITILKIEEMTAIGYRKYPEAVLQIARSGNPYLFPELRVFRTTANYWIKKADEISESGAAEAQSTYSR